jgi:hypothetical protein
VMFRETLDGMVAIAQPSHAWLSGQIIRAWGNAAFGPVTPFEDVCLGAEQHDIGWLNWERSPSLNTASGLPHSFREVSIAVHTEIWRQGTELALAFGRYPALLASLHGAGLYAAFDISAATDADAAIVRAFLSGQQAIQARLLYGLRRDAHLGAFATPSMVERNRGLVRSADRMSIAICTGMRDLAIRTDNAHQGVIRQVPTADGQTDLCMELVDGDMTRVAVSPWPFATSVVRVCCEGVRLLGRLFDDEAEMRAALRDAEKVVLPAELRPG